MVACGGGIHRGGRGLQPAPGRAPRQAFLRRGRGTSLRRGARFLASIAFLAAACGSDPEAAGLASAEPSPTGTSEAAVADGRHFGYIRIADVASSKLTFDRAEFLTGAEAEAAAQAAGDEAFDSYIRNPDETTVELTLAADAELSVVDWMDCCESTTGERRGFLTAFRPGADREVYRGPDSAYWLTVSDGVVTKVEEQYLP